MKCHVCGGQLQSLRSDMPFKLGPKRIVIFKDLPILQCDACSDYAIEDDVMACVEEALGKTDQSVEVEIVQIAA